MKANLADAFAPNYQSLTYKKTVCKHFYKFKIPHIGNIELDSNIELELAFRKNKQKLQPSI